MAVQGGLCDVHLRVDWRMWTPKRHSDSTGGVERKWRGMSTDGREVTLLTRAGCGACAPARERLLVVCEEFGLELTCIDVDEAAATDPELRANSATDCRWYCSTDVSTVTGRSTKSAFARIYASKGTLKVGSSDAVQVGPHVAQSQRLCAWVHKQLPWCEQFPGAS